MDGGDGGGEVEGSARLESERESEGVEGEVGVGKHMGEEREGLVVPALVDIGRQELGQLEQTLVHGAKE